MREDCVMDAALVAAEFAAGQLPPERMPEAATELLVAGHDSPALRQAAGLDGADPREQRAMLGQALEELGELPLRREEVGRRLFRVWAERIVAGKVEPLEGARALYLLEIDYQVELPDPLGQYGALDSGDFNAPGVEQAYQRDIREAAGRWLDSNPI
jgi:hypothetical protein